jgi:eukaryotic-like serine/threonine-protein kinase
MPRASRDILIDTRAMTGSADTPGYFAFISYSHRDKLWADWLHKSLETYRVPRRLVGQTTTAGVIPQRLVPIFRDRDELASATDLGRKVHAAMAQSANLIVICSPHSATSRWVNEEVLAFKQFGRSERIFCLVVGGEPNASDMPGREAEECFAPALRHVIHADGQLASERTEPIAADARPGKDGKANAKLKLIAGLLDVGFDRLKQRELQRRNRRMVAITAAALFVMAVTTTLAIVSVIARNAAEVARASAERHQKQAEDLVGFMLGDLYEKLAQVSRLDILESVDDKAMAYFQSLPVSDVTDAAVMQRAKALEKIGVVRQEQGHLPSAMESFQAAAKLSGSFADAAPHDPARQIAYSRVLAFVGMTHWNQGRLDEAQQSFEAAQQVLQRAQSTQVSDPDLLFHLTVIDNDIGHVLEARGKIDEAESAYRSMLAHCEQLVRGIDVKSNWTSQLGSAHNNLGKVALMRGELATAVGEYAADDAIESKLSARDPKNNEQRENTMRARAILGRTLALAGAVAKGTQALQEAVDIADQLLKVDPNHAEFQEYAALYLSQLSRLHRLAGDAGIASELNARALKIFAVLIKQDAANAFWQLESAEAQIEQAAQSLAAGQRDAARSQVQAALDALDPLLANRPDDRNTLLADASARLLLAAATEEISIAQALRNSALDTLRARKDAGDDPRVLAIEVAALLGLNRSGEANGLIQRLRESGYRDPELSAMLQRQHIEYPVNAEFQQRLEAAIRQF